MNKATNRGGRREGSGRRPAEARRVNLTVRVDPLTKERIRILREEHGLAIGHHVDAMVEALFEAVTKGTNNL